MKDKKLEDIPFEDKKVEEEINTPEATLTTVEFDAGSNDTSDEPSDIDIDKPNTITEVDRSKSIITCRGTPLSGIRKLRRIEGQVLAASVILKKPFIPFGSMPGHWGLKGKTREIAKAEYELSRIGIQEVFLKFKLLRIEFADDNESNDYFRKLLKIFVDYNNIEAKEAQYILVEINDDDLYERAKKTLALMLDHQYIDEITFDFKMLHLNHLDLNDKSTTNINVIESKGILDYKKLTDRTGDERLEKASYQTLNECAKYHIETLKLLLKYKMIEEKEYDFKIFEYEKFDTAKNRQLRKLELEYTHAIISEEEYVFETSLLKAESQQIADLLVLNYKHKNGLLDKDVVYEKEKATILDEPWIKCEASAQPDDPRFGEFDMDWNEQFVEQLREAGYQGVTGEELVQEWFETLIKGIADDIRYAGEDSLDDLEQSIIIGKNKLDDNKTEYY